jgi:hypothetical protein
MSRAPKDEQSCIGPSGMRQEIDHCPRHVLNTEHTTFQLERLMPVTLIATNFVFITGNPGNQWVYCGTPDTSVDFPTPTPDTDTAQIPLLRTTFLRKSRFIAFMRALASGPQITCSWQIKCTRTHRQLGAVGSFPHKQNETIHGDPMKRPRSVSAPGSNLRR